MSLPSQEAYLMGLVHAQLSLANPRRPDLQAVDVAALVDTGAVHLCLPEHVAVQLALEELEKREVTLADGRRRLVPYCGPVEVRFENRRCFTGALILGDSVLAGAIPLEDMDLVVHPAGRKVTVNPESPNFPSALVKSTTEAARPDVKPLTPFIAPPRSRTPKFPSPIVPCVPDKRR